MRAADGRVEHPEDIRPLLWLRKTVVYLLGAVSRFRAEGWPMSAVHSFTSDRLQAVRKGASWEGHSACGGQ